jgi:phosphoglycolate phosphatase
MQHFIFDLDGTITNPQPGIVGGYRYAFEKLGFPDKSDKELISLIGPPLKYVFSKMYEFSEEDAIAGVNFYREYYYGQGGMYDAIIFDGMKDLFQSLKDKNKTLHVATNKGLHVDKILEHFEVLEFFTSIEHYNEEKNVLNKETMIENILQNENITDKSKVVMIGDRDHDLGAAKKVGVQAVGVLYGFGNKEELEKCEPKHMVSNVAELHHVLHQF